MGFEYEDDWGSDFDEPYDDGYHDQVGDFDWDPHYDVYTYPVTDRTDERRTEDWDRDRGDRAAPGQPRGREQKRVVDREKRLKRIRGVVTRMRPGRDVAHGDHMVHEIRFEDRPTIMADFGPGMTAKRMPIEVDERVTLRGRRERHEGHEVFAVHEIVDDGETYTLRGPRTRNSEDDGDGDGNDDDGGDTRNENDFLRTTPADPCLGRGRSSSSSARLPRLDPISAAEESGPAGSADIDDMMPDSPIRPATATAPAAASAPTRILLVATPATATSLLPALRAEADPIDVVRLALVGPPPSREEGAALESGCEGIIDVGDLGAALEMYEIDIVVVSLPAAFEDLVPGIRRRVRSAGRETRVVRPLRDQILGSPSPDRSDPVLRIRKGRVDPARLLARRPRPVDEVSIDASIEGRRVLVTGAGGSIGSELARRVARHRPAEIILVERSENALFEIDRGLDHDHPEIARRAVLHDVVDEERTAERIGDLGPHVVFHAAAHKHVPMLEEHPREAVRNNVFGTRSILEASVAAGADTFVLVSTDKAVRPRSIMGATKRIAERLVQRVAADLGPDRLRGRIVRFGNVLGSSGSVLRIWSSQLRDGRPITVTDPAMTRYFMTIPEAATLVLQAAAFADDPADRTIGPADVHLLDMGEPVPILDLAHRFLALQERFGVVVPSEGDPVAAARAAAGPSAVPIVMTGTRPGERLHETLADEGEPMHPTPHPGIHRLRSMPPEADWLADVLAELADAIVEGRSEEVVAAVRRAVPSLRLEDEAPARSGTMAIPVPRRPVHAAA